MMFVILTLVVVMAHVRLTDLHFAAVTCTTYRRCTVMGP